MVKTGSNEIRQAFLDFFKRHKHQVVDSSSLVPASDPTLLFTNAGMVQFKDTFLGLEKRPYKTATSSQRCVRAGGKHNDLENVGYTARHHTFFEMLGNFSFGDYFKREAINYAWDFLTKELKIPVDKLWVTVYSEDEEAASIWLKEIKIDPCRFIRIATADNFWSMGDTGPCGPCSEIFYDHGSKIKGGPPGTPEQDGDRYVEIWNLVFMQYNRGADGSQVPLPKPSVDTGMGLERLAAVMQGVHNNYEIDLFKQLLKATADITGSGKKNLNALRVIADHIRSSAFLIVDGVMPSNEKRGYVLRRIIRRAIRHGFDLGVKEPFFYRLVQPLCEQMGAAYPELIQASKQVELTIKTEEERFAETLETGMKVLQASIEQLSGKTLSGETVFDLYATYGFPKDLTADITRQRKLKIDWDGYDKAEQTHKEKGGAGKSFAVVLPANISTEFTGYTRMQDQAKVQAIYKQDQAVDELKAGENAVVYLDQTPFYAESGGQVGDRGELKNDNSVFKVQDTQKYHAHVGKLEQGRLAIGDSIACRVDQGLRAATQSNHSATHLLHAALRQVLGNHVQQKGSLVDSNRLRFDFSHTKPVSRKEIMSIEQIVNDQIRENAAVETNLMNYKQAIKAGAMALFGEKYGDEVRVLKIGDFSTELCGGTHVQRAGDIGFFKILAEAGVAAGVRRLEAITGAKAVQWAEKVEAQVQQIADMLKATPEQMTQRMQQNMDRLRSLEKEVEALKAKSAKNKGDQLLDKVTEVAGIKLITAQLEDSDMKTLRETADKLKDKLGSGAVVLATTGAGRVQLVAGVTRDLNNKLKAGDLVNVVAKQVGGKGGGRADFAQAGGDQPENLQNALNSVSKFVESQLKL